jgi:GntR family transcriptional regulator
MSTEQFARLLQDSALDKDSDVPLYQQLKRLIITSVQNGILQPDLRLLSERELSEALGISRLTVRHALSELARSGWLEISACKGAYVRCPKLEQGTNQLMGLTEDMRRRGHAVSSQILEAALIPAASSPLLVPGLDRGDLVLLERLRLVDGEPLGIERSYLPHRLCPGILNLDLADNSLYRILREQYRIRPLRAEQTYEAVTTGKRESALLGIAEGTPALSLQRIVYLRTEEVIEYGWAWYRGDRYRFQAVLLDNSAPA